MEYRDTKPKFTGILAGILLVILCCYGLKNPNITIIRKIMAYIGVVIFSVITIVLCYRYIKYSPKVRIVINQDGIILPNYIIKWDDISSYRKNYLINRINAKVGLLSIFLKNPNDYKDFLSNKSKPGNDLGKQLGHGDINIPFANCTSSYDTAIEEMKLFLKKDPDINSLYKCGNSPTPGPLG